MSASPAMTTGRLSPSVLDLDCAAEADRIARRLVELVGSLKRRGVVVGLSGGIDSSVCAALAVRAFGPQRVCGLLMPEQDSSSASSRLGRQLAEHLGIQWHLHDIAPTLSAIGCYQWRDEAIRAVFPEYGDGWKNKIAITGSGEGRITYFELVVQSPDGQVHRKRLPAKQYLQIVAATNFKQRLRKTLEYCHADRLNFAVLGTPNRLEYDQGFFVKNGDGSADVKPIAHLYKTQVYAMAHYLGLPAEICSAKPTTDTYSMPQGQDEFYFTLPYAQMDVALWAYNHRVDSAELAEVLGISREFAERTYQDIEAKRRFAAYLHSRPLLVEPVTEL